MAKPVLIEVRTNKRWYVTIGDAKIAWLPGEKVISMDVVESAS